MTLTQAASRGHSSTTAWSFYGRLLPGWSQRVVANRRFRQRPDQSRCDSGKSQRAVHHLLLTTLTTVNHSAALSDPLLVIMPRRVQSNILTRHRAALTVLELFVVAAIIAVLVALVLPAVQSARESARRSQCSNRLKQIGIALHGYHDLLSTLPPGWRDDHMGESAFGWINGILPLLEQHSLFEAIDFEGRIDNPLHDSVVQTQLPLLRCPSDVGLWQFPLRDHDTHSVILMSLPLSNYVGVFGTRDPDGTVQEGDGPFIRNRSIRFAEFESGLGSTFLAGERSSDHLAATWFGFLYQGEEAQSRVTGFIRPPPGSDSADESEFSSRHTGGAYFLWGDGRVAFVSEAMDREQYRQLGTLVAE